MTFQRGALLISFMAALVVYLVMVVWTLPTIQTEAGDLLPFDLRFSGYSYAEAQAFLSALSDEGRALYLGPQHNLDLAYPALMAIFIGLAIWMAGSDLPLVFRLVGIAAAIGGAGFDYVENARVAVLLVTPMDQLDASLAATASFATVWKSRITTIAFVLLFGFLAHKGITRIRNGRPQT